MKGNSLSTLKWHFDVEIYIICKCSFLKIYFKDVTYMFRIINCASFSQENALIYQLGQIFWDYQ